MAFSIFIFLFLIVAIVYFIVNVFYVYIPTYQKNVQVNKILDQVQQAITFVNQISPGVTTSLNNFIEIENKVLVCTAGCLLNPIFCPPGCS
jgi:cell division protein FtsL